MADQAEGLRLLISGRQPEADANKAKTRIITVSSGKGGVGKTSLVVNLAIALSKGGHKVMIMDADLGMANVDIMLGLVPRFTIHDVLQGHKSLGEIIITGAEGVKIIPGCSGIFEMANLNGSHRELLLQQIGQYAQGMDFVLIDTGAGISSSVLGFIAAADEVIIVITPEPTSITDGYGIIKILSKFKLHKQVHLVVNMAANLQEAQESARKIERVVRQYLEVAIDRLGVIYFDDKVKKSVQEMIPFTTQYPYSRAARDVSRIADNIITNKIGFNAGKPDFTQKLLRLLK